MLPDPEEPWSHFFKRLLNFGLHKPPLVQKNSLPLEKKNTVYMKVQTKILESEYNNKSKILFFKIHF